MQVTSCLCGHLGGPDILARQHAKHCSGARHRPRRCGYRLPSGPNGASPIIYSVHFKSSQDAFCKIEKEKNESRDIHVACTKTDDTNFASLMTGFQKKKHVAIPTYPLTSPPFGASHLHRPIRITPNHASDMLLSRRVHIQTHLRRAGLFNPPQQPQPASITCRIHSAILAPVPGRHSPAHPHGLHTHRHTPARLPLRLQSSRLQSSSSSAAAGPRFFCLG